MFQTPAASEPIPTYNSRRSTRASRTSSVVSKIESQSSRKKKKKQSPVVLIKSNSGPARKWAKVLRPPAAGVDFKTLQWIKVEDLTFEEKIMWDEEQRRQKGSVITDGKKNSETNEVNGDGGDPTPRAEPPTETDASASESASAKDSMEKDSSSHEVKQSFGGNTANIASTASTNPSEDSEKSIERQSKKRKIEEASPAVAAEESNPSDGSNTKEMSPNKGATTNENGEEKNWWTPRTFGIDC